MADTRFQTMTTILSAAPFDRFGVTQLTTPLHMDFYRGWIEAERHGEMSYLKEHIEKKADPKKFQPRAVSAIVVSQNYAPHPREKHVLKSARIAHYARGEDYHHWFKAEIQKTCELLQKEFPGEEFTAFTDSSPVAERDLAVRAGLGWVGKNTCVIHPKQGSLFFIGEIYTSLDLQSLSAEVPNHCGTCTRCIDICPTGALKPYQMDATLCISYLNIEAKSLPREDLRSGMGDWFFGCDLCQNVCPWNIKWHKGEVASELRTEKILPLSQDTRALLVQDLRFILSSSNSALEKAFFGTALLRAGGKRLKRNAIIVATNQGLRELLPEITLLKKVEYLHEICTWSEKVLET